MSEAATPKGESTDNSNVVAIETDAERRLAQNQKACGLALRKALREMLKIEEKLEAMGRDSNQAAEYSDELFAMGKYLREL